MNDLLVIRTTDYHTGGEPFRIVADVLPELDGPGTVVERRERAIAADGVQRLRRILCHEPRGHADMYGGFLTPPDDDGAHFGVLFWHKDGFSTACGHGTIALGAWAVDTGIVAAPALGEVEVVVDVPSGRVRATVICVGGEVDRVRFTNVPSYAVARGVPVQTARGSTSVDIGFGGALYAVVPAADFGLRVAAPDYTALIATGREIRDQLNASPIAHHAPDPRLSGIYGTIFTEVVDGLHQRNVTVFADGEVDRSPCGSGTSARVALLADSGDLGDRDILLHDSIVGSRFEARIAAHVEVDGRAAVIPEVTGTAYRMGRSEFVVDPRDPLGEGFVLR